jgi:tripartite-type tricarboxylate transporter receptor subunit TctC
VRTLPSVPTVAESGYPGYEAVNWFGLEVPARTPEDIVRKLNGAIRQTLAMGEVREFYEHRGAEVATSTPEEMRAFVQSEMTKWAAVVKASGARVD